MGPTAYEQTTQGSPMSYRIELGSGMVTWDGTERHTDRYGTIALASTQFGTSAPVASWKLDEDIIRRYEGQVGVLIAVVTESRVSNHVGDNARKIRPSRPEVGEEIKLGFGRLFLQENKNWFGHEPCGGSNFVGVMPLLGDMRTHDWMDPKALYRAHEQTVTLYFDLGATMPEYAEPRERERSNSGTYAMGFTTSEHVDENGEHYVQAKHYVRPINLNSE